MMKFIKKVSFGLIALSFASCLDVFDDDPEILIGNVCLYSTNGAKQKRLMLRTEKSYFTSIVDGTVEEIFVTDSTIYTKNYFGELNSYYLIRHKKGNEITKVREIDSIKYAKLIQDNKLKFAYHEEQHGN